MFEGQSTYYLSINRNKRSIALDFGDPGDIERGAATLPQTADVVLENFKPGGLERFGLDYASVAERNPAVVYASITGFGTAGGATLPGYDLLVQAMSGLMSLTGDPGFPAYRSGVAVFDVITGLHAAIGVLFRPARAHPERPGPAHRGEPHVLGLVRHGQPDRWVPAQRKRAHPHGAMSTPASTLTSRSPQRTVKSSWPSATTRQFRTLCDAIGWHMDWLMTRGFLHAAAAKPQPDGIAAPSCGTLLATRPASEWFDIFTEARLPCAPINDVRGGIEFAERLGLEPVVEVGAGDEAIPGVRNPITFSATPASYDLVPPGIDADHGDILEWLYSAPQRLTLLPKQQPHKLPAPVHGMIKRTHDHHRLTRRRDLGLLSHLDDQLTPDGRRRDPRQGP